MYKNADPQDRKFFDTWFANKYYISMLNQENESMYWDRCSYEQQQVLVGILFGADNFQLHDQKHAKALGRTLETNMGMPDFNVKFIKFVN